MNTHHLCRVSQHGRNANPRSNDLSDHASLFLCRVFGTVSYYVQKLFSEYQGVRYIQTEVVSSDGDGHGHGIAASASCQNEACSKIAFKVGQAGDRKVRALRVCLTESKVDCVQP